MRNTAQALTGARKVSNQTLQLIKEFEGYSAVAYRDGANIWTIGYGNTFYKDGTKVKQGDIISRSQAEDLFKHVVEDFASKVDEVVIPLLNECQFEALVSIAYNIGIDAFKKSKLLAKINANPADPSIQKEFERWVNAGQQRNVRGLVNRRKKEAELYFSQNC